MIRFLRLFATFRRLEADFQQVLKNEVSAHAYTRDELEVGQRALENERVRRIAAESVAVERRGEIDRLIDQMNQMREDMAKLGQERIRSVDAINLKLMDNRRAETPDLAAFQKNQVVSAVKESLRTDIRSSHRAVDMAVLTALHPQFRDRIIANAPKLAGEEQESAA